MFVESEYDEACYQELYRIMPNRSGSELSLEFIASGRGGQGNAEAVKHLVTNLRAAGNDSVFGVVDRDSRSGVPEGVCYVPGRYSLENLVLDPLPVGVFLLRELLVDPPAMGLPPTIKHFELRAEHTQAIADFVSSAVTTDSDDISSVTVQYIDGFTVAVPAFYININGHDLEERLTSEFLPLRGYGSALKMSVIQRALGDLPGFIPSHVEAIFLQLLSV